MIVFSSTRSCSLKNRVLILNSYFAGNGEYTSIESTGACLFSRPCLVFIPIPFIYVVDVLPRSLGTISCSLSPRERGLSFPIAGLKGATRVCCSSRKQQSSSLDLAKWKKLSIVICPFDIYSRCRATDSLIVFGSQSIKNLIFSSFS